MRCTMYTMINRRCTMRCTMYTMINRRNKHKQFWSVQEHNPLEQFVTLKKIVIFIEHHDCRDAFIKIWTRPSLDIVSWITSTRGVHFFVILMHLMCIPQKETYFLWYIYFWCLCLKRGELFLSRKAF